MDGKNGRSCNCMGHLCAELHVYGMESIGVRNLVLASLKHMKRIKY